MNGAVWVFRRELQRVFALKAAFSVLVAAIILYAVFYPQPYLNEALREVPIVLIDQDGTVSSRELARRIEATSDIAIAAVLPDLPNAEREIYARRAFGILLIPQNFERDLLHGRASPIALYADASYFLIYQRVSGAIAAVARTFGVAVETARLIGVGVDPASALPATDPMPLTTVPLFNPQGGYATYLLPAAFVLILQQTLLIGVGLLGTLSEARSSDEDHLHRPDPQPGAAAVVVGKLAAYLVLQAAIFPFYLVGLPYVYGVPRLGSVMAILIFAVPFVLAVGGLGLVMAAIFRKPLTVQLACAAIGLPFFFLAGFAWPAEAIPAPLRIVSLLVPSTSAIDGFVRLSQMGAPLADVRPQLFALWALTLAYGGTAFALIKHRMDRSIAPRSDRCRGL